MIQVNNLSFHYQGVKRNVFSDFNMTLKENNIYGLLGKNGTGKSTLLYLSVVCCVNSRALFLSTEYLLVIVAQMYFVTFL